MKIALFGSTGNSGSLLLDRFLEEGHEPRILVRDRARVVQRSERLQIIEGNVTDPHSVDLCLEGCEIVYILLGTKDNKRTSLFSAGTANIVRSMEKHGIKRVVCLSSAGILGRDVGISVRIFILLKLRWSFRDKRKQLKILSASDLDWTLVRSTEFKPGKPPGEIVVSYDKAVKPSISMHSLIEFLYAEIENKKNIRKMPIIGD